MSPAYSFIRVFIHVSVIIITLLGNILGAGIPTVSADHILADSFLDMVVLGADLFYFGDGGLSGDYDNNDYKHLMYINGDIGIPGLAAEMDNATLAAMALNGSVFIDMDDVYSAMYPSESITGEGAEGWVTVWVDAGYSLFSASFSALGPGTVGFDRIHMDHPDSEQDPTRAGYELTFLSGCGFVKMTGFTKTISGFELGETDMFGDNACFNLSASMYNLTWNLLRFEVDYTTLEFVLQQAFSGFIPGHIDTSIPQFINKTNEAFNDFFSKQAVDEDPNNGSYEIIPPPSFGVRTFTSTDSGVRTAVGASFDYIIGGNDINGDDTPDNRYEADALTIVNSRFHTTGNQTKDYRVRIASTLPTGWRITPLDDDWEINDKSFEQSEVPGSNDIVTTYVNMQWVVDHDPGANNQADVEFVLEYKDCSLCTWHDLDRLSQAFFHTDQVGGQLPPIIIHSHPSPMPEIDGGDVYPVSVSVSDPNGDPITAVDLKYETAAGEYSLALTHQSGTTWTGQIPAEHTLLGSDPVDYMLLEYWFEASDPFFVERQPDGSSSYLVSIRPSGSTQPTYTLTGFVKDISNNPLANVTITTGYQSALTDPSGYYSINGIPAGTHNVVLTLDGYTFTPSNYQVTLPPSQSANFTGTAFVAGDTFTFVATEDVHLRKAYPNDVFNWSSIQAGVEWYGGHQKVVGLLKFGTLSTYPDIQGKTVYSAALQLNPVSVDTNTGLRLWQVGSATGGSWNESTTYNSFPYETMGWYDNLGQAMKGYISFTVRPSDEGVWVNIASGNGLTLRTAVQAVIDGADPNYGFLLDAAIADLDSAPLFSSSESSDPPHLEVKVLTGVPDLVVNDITLSPSPLAGTTYEVGQIINIQYTVFNNGPGGADISRAATYLGSTSGDFSHYLDDFSSGMILAGDDDTDDVDYTFTSADIGTRYIIVKADWEGDVSESYENNNILFVGPLNIVPANTAPALSGIPDQAVDEDGSLLNAVDLWAYASDAQTTDSELRYSILNNPEPMAGISIRDNRYVSIQPATDWNGIVDVDIQASDPQGASSLDTLRLTVNPVNDAPSISPPVPSQNALVNQPITIDLTPFEQDVEESGSSLDWTIIGLDHAVVSGEGSDDDYLTFTPAVDYLGMDNITLVLSDTQGGHRSQGLVLSWYTPAPEIDIKGNGRTIVDGSSIPLTENHTDFGSVKASEGVVSRTFTIYNIGDANLILNDPLPVGLTGPNAAEYLISVMPSSVIAPGDSTSFTIEFDPDAFGLRQAIVSINNDDLNESPYSFDIQGTGTPDGTFMYLPVVMNKYTPGIIKVTIDTIIQNNAVFHDSFYELGLTVGDLTNDGNLDLVVTKGDETGDAGVAVFQRSSGIWDAGTLLSGTSKTGASKPIIAPIRNDGLNWLVFYEHQSGNAGGWLRGFRFNGTGLSENRDVAVRSGWPGWMSPGIADLNQDGALEIWFAQLYGSPTNHIHFAKWNSVSSAYEVVEIKDGGPSSSEILARPETGDFLGNGTSSLIWVSQNDKIELVTYTPGSGIYNHTSSPIGISGGDISSIATGSFNSSAGTDIAVMTWTGSASVLHIISGGTFTITDIPVSSGEFFRVIRMADLDGNGLSEIYAASTSGNLYGYDAVSGWRLLESQSGVYWWDSVKVLWPGLLSDDVLFIGRIDSQTFRVISLSSD